ncbi:hypothetical protein LWI29_006774 [Acer saccharum]|uniref:RRM domain-containing protein n=1 Tax=Acer saccharum TaxID=4024 RepID=A0AA39RR25_ACESA|nr:hypothetical protein LWI29_006774 [Acer saccharum]KAK1557516.1 hypothetical protein Q3G72_026095 [Acer saccharum]
MWAATVSSYPQVISANPPTIRVNRTPLNLRASLPNYPLASRIMVRNLPFTTHESSLKQEFSSFGEIAEVNLVKDKSTRRSKGYAFIQYTNQDDALLALENMDHKEFDGRLIYIEIAKPGRDTFGGFPITSGPPKKQHTPEPPKKQHSPEQDEVADCWY